MSHPRGNTDLNRWSRWMDALALLFLVRVLGQFGVWWGTLNFLPPFREWQSGILPYPLLLVFQLTILVAMYMIHKKGAVWVLSVLLSYLARFRIILPSCGPRSKVSQVISIVTALRVSAVIYGGAMCLRMLLFLQAQWRGEVFLGGWIPILFHWVLASYILLLAQVLSLSGNNPDASED